jgi:hypothetical protein
MFFSDSPPRLSHPTENYKGPKHPLIQHLTLLLFYWLFDELSESLFFEYAA